MTKTKLIAEIGWNHMGSLKLAEQMIKAASQSGADYAKFQTWSVSNLKPGPWDKDGRKQIYEKAELKESNYIEIKKICKKYKIAFLTSLFNHEDYKLIKKLNLQEIKIPSPENRNSQLLKFCSKKIQENLSFNWCCNN
ncbi:N-acetylneuraminate synthase family protein [Candidatus Pelagibacter sp.]|nr:N-acetylneuraminate synthase family protein [Candidatus Pelagibacter sp.]